MKKLLLAIVGLLVFAMATPSEARTHRHHHKHKHHRHHVAKVKKPAIPCNFFMGPICWGESFNADKPVATTRRTRRSQSYGAPTPSWGYTSSNLVHTARSYMGTNPTGWRHVWCGRFMAMVAPRAAARIRNPNFARNWAHAGPRYSSCTVGAVAVLARGRRGGHVGVVTACTPQGPQIVSGNHGHRVGEGVYSSHRVIAYVDAS